MRRNFGRPRAPRSTRADAQRVFDPELLRPIIGTLKSRVKVTRQEPKLAGLLKDLIAVDGTFFTVAARVAWALYNKSNGPDAPPRKGNFRADVHYDVLRGVPERAVVTDGRTAEQDTLAQTLQTKKIYVIDVSYQTH